MAEADQTTSLEINKSIRRTLTPVLKAHGFKTVQGRNYWAHNPDSIWVLVVHAVGSYFSDVTGWPPMSVAVHMGVWLDYVPYETGPIKTGSQGQPLPMEHQCIDTCRTVLSCSLDQSARKAALPNPVERARTDLWWIDRNGGNVEEVIRNIADQFISEGLPWFRSVADPATLFQMAVGDRDCYIKYLVVAALAKRLNLRDEYAKYSRTLREECTTIGHEYPPFLTDEIP